MIIIGVVVLVATIVALVEGEDPSVDLTIAWIFAPIIGLLAAMLMGIPLYNHTEYRIAQRTPLVNIADGQGIQGHWGFLGAGSLSDTQIFSWYESDGGNSYIRKSADANVSRIHYLRSGKPYYTVTREYYTKHGFFQLWAVNMNNSSDLRDVKYYDFYVPRGSIVGSYTLNNR